MRNVAIQLSCAIIGLALVLAASTANAQNNPTQAQMHETRAKAARDARQWNTAAAEYTQAYRYDPKPKYLFNVALASDFAGKKQVALESFRAYLAKDPNGKYAVTARAKVQELSDAIAKGRSATTAAMIAAHVRAAERYRREAKHDGSAFEYRKAYALSKNTEYLFEVGESYRMMGAKKQAIMAYKNYLKADLAGKFAMTARTRVNELERQTVKKVSGKPKAVAPVQPRGIAAAPTATPRVVRMPRKTTKTKTKKGKMRWVVAVAALAAGLVIDLGASSSTNGAWDALDVVPIGLYGTAGVAVLVF